MIQVIRFDDIKHFDCGCHKKTINQGKDFERLNSHGSTYVQKNNS